MPVEKAASNDPVCTAAVCHQLQSRCVANLHEQYIPKCVRVTSDRLADFKGSNVSFRYNQSNIAYRKCNLALVLEVPIHTQQLMP